MDRGRLTRNTFNKGRNTDQDRNKISPDQYLEAHNLEMVGDGTFYSLQNIQGTVNVQDILGLDITLINSCLGVFRTYWDIDSEIRQCLTIFTLSTSNLFKIWCYDISGNTLYEIYEEAVGNDYDTEDRVIDAKTYGENGVDVIYFTDNYHEVRKLICELPSPYTPNYTTAYSLSLQRRGGLGSVDFSAMTTGSLLSGTYQFAYRMADPTTKTFTKWSSLTNPIHVYSSSTLSDQVYSGVGLPTPFGILLNIDPTADEIAQFTYFQVAVVENIYPTTITTIGSLLPLELTANRLSYEYKSNTKISEIAIDDLVIDFAQIKTVKTLNIKQNRLFLGNIKYTDLSFDNGDPSITSGLVIQDAVSMYAPFSKQEFSTTRLGYFRDEVYRFGLVYSDKYGNRSPVKALDLTAVTDNQKTAGIDIKFPSRSLNTTYGLWNSSGNLQSLGLRLVGVKNHPTWATRVEVVRAKRIKNIQFQTPVVPMVTVKGIGSLDNYPITSTTKTYPNATPMTSTEVLVPRNYFWPESRDIIANDLAVSVPPVSGTPNYGGPGEARFNPKYSIDTVRVYPQSTLYGGTPFSFTGAEKMTMVDYALLKNSITDFNSSVVSGDNVNTSVTGTFYATNSNQYYYNPVSFSPLSSIPQNIGISAYEYLPNLSEGTEISGKSLEKYSLLETPGVDDLGVKPTINAAGVFKLQTSFPEVPSATLGFQAGVFNRRAVGGNNYIVGASGMKYDSTYNSTYGFDTNSNKYINEYTNYTSDSYTSILGIANIVIGQTDDRYGKIDSAHEYISTGTSYSFSDSEIADIELGNPVLVDLDVWGGDCFVGPQLFKISDSSYSIVDAVKWYGTNQANTERYWNKRIFNNFNSATTVPTSIAMPIAVKNACQFIEVVLESEYNGFVRDLDLPKKLTTSSTIPVLGITDEASARSPLTYKYNLNLSKQNDQKVYFPTPAYVPIQNNFKARILYSDIKIYNSSEQGFDVFRVLNYYDLEEKRGGITKLSLAGDNLYAVQERGVVYLPTGQTQLEQTDAGSLSVGTSTVIGRPIIVDSERGGQHLRGIVETGTIIFVPDNLNKCIYILQGQELKNISAGTENNTLFRSLFADIIPEKNIIGIYDPIRLEYWMVDNESFSCQIFNEKFGFIGDYEFSEDSKLEGGVYADQNLYLIGTGTDDTGKLAVHEMYTGDNNSLMGEIVVPRVTISVNPDEDISKVFDNIMLSASDRLDSLELVVNHESSLADQSTVVNLDQESVEGNFRVKVLLDVNKSRLRGLRLLATIKWGELTSNVSSLYTKYRLSKRTPF